MPDIIREAVIQENVEYGRIWKDMREARQDLAARDQRLDFALVQTLGNNPRHRINIANDIKTKIIMNRRMGVPTTPHPDRLTIAPSGDIRFNIGETVPYQFSR